MSIAIAVMCEESQRITTEFRNLGIEAYSFDLMPCSGDHPEWHVQGDCLPYINGNCTFTTMDGKKHTINGKWTCIIAHPPCQHLSNSGARFFEQKRKDGRQRRGIEFFCKFLTADCDHVAIENPVNIISGNYIKTYFPDLCEQYGLPIKPAQRIQPYEHGHAVSKTTCLWLKNLPLLKPTNIVAPEKIHSKGKSGGYSGNSWFCRDENGKILSYNDPRTSIIRSKTYPGIAQAVANQWSQYLLKDRKEDINIRSETTH